MEMKQLRVAAEIKAGADGVIEGYGSVFGNVDSYGDIVVAGAFERTLVAAKAEGRLPAMLWQHNPDEPIGVWTEMRQDKRGLVVKGQVAMTTQRGREAFELIKMGALSGLSIGYSTVKSTFDEQTGVRSLVDLDLWEVSPVTFPANGAARITAAKAAITTERDFETFLRDSGFSRSEAERITLHGFKAKQGDPAEADSTVQGDPAAEELLTLIEAAKAALVR